MSTRIRVVLPAPLWPSTPSVVPGATSRSMPARACTSPKRTCRSSTSTAAPVIAVASVVGPAQHGPLPSLGAVVQHALCVAGAVGRVVGEDGVDLPGAERDVGGVDPHLVLDGVAAAVRLGHVVAETGGGEPVGGGDDVGARANLDAEVVERRARLGVLEQHQLERRIGDLEVGVAGALLGRADAEHVGVEAGGGLDVAHVQRELDAAGVHDGPPRVRSRPMRESPPMTNRSGTGRTPGRKLRPFRATFVSTVQETQMNADVTVADTPRAGLDDSWTDTLDRLQAFVAARVDDRELAADITQDVIVRSIASGALERVDNPAAWLYRSARNAVIDHYRTRRTHASLESLDAWPEPDVDDLPDDATRELSRCLQPMLDQLSPAARDALVRVDVDGQTQLRAARQLGLSLSGMKSRVQRARRDLKDLLEQCCAVDVDRRGGIADYHPTASGCGCNAATPAGCG